MTMTKIERSAPAIHAALMESSPSEATQFIEAYRAALVEAAETSGLADAEAVLTHWWGIAHIRANPLTSEEREIVRRIRDGADLPAGPPLAEDPRS